MDSHPQVEQLSSSDDEETQPENVELNNKEESDKEDEITEEKSPVFEVRVRTGTELKEEGNVFFKSGEFESAYKTYRRALHHVEFDELSYNFELMDEHRAQVDQVRIPLLLNLAACNLKLYASDEVPKFAKKMDETIDYCNQALKLEPENLKGLFRRAQAQFRKEKPESSIEDLKKVLEKNPKDKMARELYKKSLEIVKKDKKMQKEFWKTTFEKQEEEAKQDEAQQDLKEENKASKIVTNSWTSMLFSPCEWLLSLFAKDKTD